MAKDQNKQLGTSESMSVEVGAETDFSDTATASNRVDDTEPGITRDVNTARQEAEADQPSSISQPDENEEVSESEAPQTERSNGDFNPHGDEVSKETNHPPPDLNLTHRIIHQGSEFRASNYADHTRKQNPTHLTRSPVESRDRKANGVTSLGHANDDGSKIFPRSVIEGYYSPLHQYLIRGEDVNSVDASGRSLLHYTAQTHTDETYNCIALLIERGANVNQVTETEGATALHLALQLSGRDVVERTALQLLDAGADYTIRNQRLRNCIDVALAHGHLRLGSLMLASESTETLRSTSIRESRPQPPGQMDDRLLQRDSANAGGEVARTNLTLHEAQHGAAQEARRKLHHLKAEESNVMLREAVLKGDVQLAKYCLSEGADPNVEFKGAYCLHYAVHRSEINRVEMVDLLCDFGADVNMIDYEDDTPMNLCIKTSENRRRGEMADIVKKLLSFKADRDTKDLDGKDALTLAKTYGYQDIVSLLQSFSGPYRTPSRTPSRSPVRSMGSPFKRTPSVQNTPADEEIDHSKPDENGLYPIHLLILNDEIDESFKADLIDEFKLEKVDFNVASVNDKDTALHFAVGRKEKLSMMKLISGSANPDQANAEGITPRDLIERLEDDDFKKAFEEALAKQNAAKNWKRAGNKAKHCVLL